MYVVAIGYTFFEDLPTGPALSGVGRGKKTTFIVSTECIQHLIKGARGIATALLTNLHQQIVVMYSHMFLHCK